MITVTSVEAQNKFGQLLDTVQREPVIITRHGRATAYMVSPQDMQDLQDLQAARLKRSEAVAEFEAHFARVDPHLTPAVRELSDDDVVRLVKESR
jgi:prevent-host-death family protein